MPSRATRRAGTPSPGSSQARKPVAPGDKAALEHEAGTNCLRRFAELVGTDLPRGTHGGGGDVSIRTGPGCPSAANRTGR